MKKIVLIVLLVFSVLLFVGCDVEQLLTSKVDDKNNTSFIVIDNNDDEIKRIGILCTLEEAYKKKYISKNDLLDLHDNIENRVKFELDKDIEQKILNDYLIDVKKNFADATDATIDDVSIYGYYGHYNNLYVVRLDNIFTMYLSLMEELNIDGVVFSYSGPVYMVWLEENNILTTPIDGTYYGKLCYTNPGLSSISVDMVFEISDTKLIINDDKELKIEECEYDGHFFDNLVLEKSYSLDYRQMFEYPNKGWFALLESSETRKKGYSILISKFNTIYVFKTVFDLENDTYYIHAIYELINQVEQTNVINSLFVDKYYFGMILYVQPNLLSPREASSMTFQDDELIIGDNKYKLEEKIFDERFIKIDDDKLNNLFSFPSKGLIARIDDASYYCIIEGNDGIVYCLECAAINSEFYECDILCAYLLAKTIKLDDSFMYRTVDDKCDSKNIAEASKVNLIQVDMTFEEVVEILGKPVAALGSGAIWYEWSLNDGTSLQIQFTPKGLVDAKLYVLRIERKYNFTNDCVLVVVKKEYSEINKVWNLDFFGDLTIKEVKDLTHRDNPDSVSNPSEFKQILKIVLKEPSYEGVLELIEELKKIDEFESAEPNYIGTWD